MINLLSQAVAQAEVVLQQVQLPNIARVILGLMTLDEYSKSYARFYKYYSLPGQPVNHHLVGMLLGLLGAGDVSDQVGRILHPAGEGSLGLHVLGAEGVAAPQGRKLRNDLNVIIAISGVVAILGTESKIFINHQQLTKVEEEKDLI